MICPACDSNSPSTGSPERFSTHQTPSNDPAAPKFTSLETFDPKNLKLPLHLCPSLPLGCRQSFERCRRAALLAYDGFKNLTEIHSLRYKAMCPPPNPNNLARPSVYSFSRAYLHSLSVDHLLNWPVLRANVVTIAHPPKIPAEILSFTVDQRAYEAYLVGFERVLTCYVNGAYWEYMRAKDAVEDVIAKANMNVVDRRMWRHFWTARFLVENESWEEDLKNMVLPSWDEIVEELDTVIWERVEGAVTLDSLVRAEREVVGVDKNDEDEYGVEGYEIYDFMLDEDVMDAG
ncbi:hypothetical protein P170DRAFT_477983 [Aspergillus steynii IBT 23096]|uniref:Uncharacterized protein n=1 Tax=Aspergillus steynii IBT 23096 TaxID=1392250 RepID=A0A2I2G2L1_9EURO|nr:uncharacterized protein P170DRAFT_477983 [Aspergillus steynii IBT 23096]PLB47120.1 hypothetical protein P170DRAFT_477983 [Aspergillus steynii IBT 23096]